MAKVLGVGGIFSKSSNPRRLSRWYSRYLGMRLESPSAAIFRSETLPRSGYTVWGPFPESTRYFGPSRKSFMVNLVVDDLDEVLQRVREGGGRVTGEVKNYPYGRFGWFLDPERNKVELWQPPETKPGRHESQKR